MRMKMMGVALGVLVLSVMQTVVADAAQEFYFSAVGARQGVFKGEARQKGLEGKIVGLTFDYSVVSPRDPASGLATGKRQHRPVRIIKPWGASSTQFFTALVMNEVLSNVTIDFFSISATGQMVLDHTVKLTNASVASITHHSDNGVVEEKTGKAPAYESIELTFQQIEIIDQLNKGMAMDAWLAVQ